MSFAKALRNYRIATLILLTLLVAVCIHERYIQRAYNRLFVPPPPPFRYTDNTHFFEEKDFNTLYHSQPQIVMFGNSMMKKMNWDELLGREDVINRGVNVDITDGMVARIDEVIALRPKIIFIEGGINDVDNGVSRDHILSNYRELVNRIKAAGIVPVINAVNQVCDFYPESKTVNASIRTLNTGLHALATETGVAIIDLNPQLAPQGELRPEFARGDGCHLTSKAYRIWKAAIELQLTTNKI
jgi:lysophospholipase L1-like esterase